MNTAQQQELSTRMPYWYQATVSFADAAAVGSSGTATINIDKTDFICTRIRVLSRVDDLGTMVTTDDIDAGGGDGGGNPDPACLLAITETGTDRAMQQTAIDAYALGVLPAPKWFRAGSTVTLAVTLLRAAAANTGVDVRIVLEGYLQY